MPPTLWPWKARLKRLIGGWLWPQATQRWQQYCTQHPILKGIAARAPNLLVKIYRPYFIQQLSCQQRVDALINHYEMNRELKLDDLLRAALNQSISIAQLVTKSGYSLEIVLKQWGHNGFREGEYGLALLWQGWEVFVMDCIFAGDLDKPYFVCSRFQACETGSSGV